MCPTSRPRTCAIGYATRTQLVREQASHTQPIQDILETSNIKLGSVVTDIMGFSGRRMIGATIEVVRNPARMPSLAIGACSATRSNLPRSKTQPKR